jgi:hypothetical protein
VVTFCIKTADEEASRVLSSMEIQIKYIVNISFLSNLLRTQPIGTFLLDIEAFYPSVMYGLVERAIKFVSSSLA